MNWWTAIWWRIAPAFIKSWTYRLRAVATIDPMITENQVNIETRPEAQLLYLRFASYEKKVSSPAFFPGPRPLFLPIAKSLWPGNPVGPPVPGCPMPSWPVTLFATHLRLRFTEFCSLVVSVPKTINRQPQPEFTSKLCSLPTFKPTPARPPDHQSSADHTPLSLPLPLWTAHLRPTPKRPHSLPNPQFLRLW